MKQIPDRQLESARKVIDLLISPERKRTIKSRDELFRGMISPGISEGEFEGLLARLVNSRLIQLMQRAFREVQAVSERRKVSLRTAALMRGIERITEAKRVRGVFP